MVDPTAIFFYESAGPRETELFLHTNSRYAWAIKFFYRKMRLSTWICIWISARLQCLLYILKFIRLFAESNLLIQVNGKGHA